ncbi:MAG: hypothetical protein EOP06_30480 [Proteobacteria bacterium]|nr:MAG: hypothetical protein EOP06_30480 [Pseudomonadota bacterium]
MLTISLSTLDSCVFLYLRQSSDAKPNIEHAFVVRDGVVFVDEKHSPYLEFRGCFLTRLWAWEIDCTKEEFQTKPGLTIQVGIKPQIQIRFA